MNKIGVCITFDPLFSHMIKIDDIAADFKKIADIGYRGIELSIRDADDIDWESFNHHLRKNNLKLVTIATGLIRKIDNVSLMDEDMDKRNLAISKLEEMIKILARNSSNTKSILIGYVKGTVSDDTDIYAQQINRFKNSLNELLTEAAVNKVTLVIEIINHNDSNFLYNIKKVEEIGRIDNIEIVPVRSNRFDDWHKVMH